MPALARAGLTWSWGTQSGSPIWALGTQTTSATTCCLLTSALASTGSEWSSWDSNQGLNMGCRHPNSILTTRPNACPSPGLCNSHLTVLLPPPSLLKAVLHAVAKTEFTRISIHSIFIAFATSLTRPSKNWCWLSLKLFLVVFPASIFNSLQEETVLSLTIVSLCGITPQALYFILLFLCCQGWRLQPRVTLSWKLAFFAKQN